MDPMDREYEIDQWLESALSQYGKAEPRAGLEDRLAASLQAERSRIAFRRRWWWVTGTAAAAVAMVSALWLGEASRAKTPPTRAGNSTTVRGETAREQVPPPRAPVTLQASATHPRRSRAGTGRDPNRVRVPKRGQFPSPAPLSDQEEMLARYVREFPQKAALLASAQTELRKRDELETAAPWRAPWPNDDSTTTLQQVE